MDPKRIITPDPTTWPQVNVYDANDVQVWVKIAGKYYRGFIAWEDADFGPMIEVYGHKVIYRIIDKPDVPFTVDYCIPCNIDGWIDPWIVSPLDSSEVILARYTKKSVMARYFFISQRWATYTQGLWVNESKPPLAWQFAPNAFEPPTPGTATK